MAHKKLGCPARIFIYCPVIRAPIAHLVYLKLAVVVEMHRVSSKFCCECVAPEHLVGNELPAVNAT